MSTKAIIFEYRWWRIMEGLNHREVDLWDYGVKINEGAYIYQDGQWFQRLRDKRYGVTLYNQATKAEHVPREIRTLCLILT